MSEETYEEILVRVNTAPKGEMVEVPDWFLRKYSLRHWMDHQVRGHAFSVVADYVCSRMKENPGITEVVVEAPCEPLQPIKTGDESISMDWAPSLLHLSFHRRFPQPPYVRESVSSLRHRTASMLARVMKGETFLITIRGRPVARLCPLKENVTVEEEK